MFFFSPSLMLCIKINEKSFLWDQIALGGKQVLVTTGCKGQTEDRAWFQKRDVNWNQYGFYEKQIAHRFRNNMVQFTFQIWTIKFLTGSIFFINCCVPSEHKQLWSTDFSANYHAFFRKIVECFLADLEFSFFLFDWLPPKARETSLLCYLTHSRRERGEKELCLLQGHLFKIKHNKLA